MQYWLDLSVSVCLASAVQCVCSLRSFCQVSLTRPVGGADLLSNTASLCLSLSLFLLCRTLFCSIFTPTISPLSPSLSPSVYW